MRLPRTPPGSSVNSGKQGDKTINGHTKSLSYKSDWEGAQKRWSAFWDREQVDRPCISVTAPTYCELPPASVHRTMEDLYFDPEIVTDRIYRVLNSTYYGGEAVPTTNYLMAGYALGCGSGVEFANDTVWHPRNWDSIDDPMPWHPGPDDPWRHKLDKLLRHILDESQGKFLVGHVCQTMMNDLLPVSLGTEQFLINLITDTDTCIQRLHETLPLWLEDMEHFRSIVDEGQPGCGHSWFHLWSEQPIGVSQSDVSCMISKDLFERFALAEVDFLGEYYDRIWYHLDGPGAVRHLPSLLSRPHVRAIQYVPGDGAPLNGPYWMDLYKQVQAAGRCLDISVPIENVEFLIRNLNPEGLLISISVDTAGQAEELIHNAVKWCGTNC